MGSHDPETVRRASEDRAPFDLETEMPLPEILSDPPTVATDDLEHKQPRDLILLPLRTDVAFPRIMMPLIVARDKGILAIDEVSKGDKLLGLAMQIDPSTENPTVAELHPVICVASLLKLLKFPDGSTRIVVQGLYRAKIAEVLSNEPILRARIEPQRDVAEEGIETEALLLSAQKLFNRYVDSGAQVSEEMRVAAMNTHSPAGYADLLGSGLPFTSQEKLEILIELNVKKRLRRLISLLSLSIDRQNLSTKIEGEVSGELNRAQREQFLRQQLEAIKRELGDSDEESGDYQDFQRRLERLNLPEQAEHEARRELDRLAQMHPSSPEYQVIRTFLDTFLSMPWNTETEDRLDIRRAKKILDHDHYNLVKVKERILEFLSVRKLKKDMKGPILCLVGPPGVGKTSLGRSVARTMGRKFHRLSLGGVHDEAEIRGHRRTYIGAMPGRIIQGLRRLGVKNPVFMLDEIDKLGRDHRGDPASALLEVLDPEQNHTFRDHYFDVEFDLSHVLFICTANNVASIPSALFDRMEVIEISGYTEEEKIAIAKRYLIPKQINEHGMEEGMIQFEDAAIQTIVRQYTHEAGLRNLEREIAGVCRKIARGFAEGQGEVTTVTVDKVHRLLGAPKFLPDEIDSARVVGSANGLAWTPVGGERLTIESIKSPATKHSLKLTGLLGEVMKESAHAALGYLRSHADELGIDRTFFEKYEIHIHVPAGAIAKDGPSAGVAMTASLLSLALDKPLRSGIAMTGEVTLTGRVLPVGGIREKMLAARRDGLKLVILPAQNQKDTLDLPTVVRKDLKFIFVKSISEVIQHLFEPASSAKSRAGKVSLKKKTGTKTPNSPGPSTNETTPPTRPAH